MTQTAAFGCWFADSKVVGPKRQPLVVYHGTSGSFDTFVPSTYAGVQGGIFFTVDRETAEAFALSAFESGGGDEIRVISAYLSIRNPKTIPASDIMDGACHSFAREFAAVDLARREGHDGLRILGVPEHDGRVADQWVVLRPEQVKSATDNCGRFDPANPSFYA